MTQSKKLAKALDKIQNEWLDICFFQEPRSWFYSNVARRNEKIDY